MVALPVFHGEAGAEVVTDMLDAFVPVMEFLVAESTSRCDVFGLLLPVVDGRNGVDLVYVAEMLHEMVLPSE